MGIPTRLGSVWLTAALNLERQAPGGLEAHMDLRYFGGYKHPNLSGQQGPPERQAQQLWNRQRSLCKIAPRLRNLNCQGEKLSFVRLSIWQELHLLTLGALWRHRILHMLRAHATSNSKLHGIQQLKTVRAGSVNQQCKLLTGHKEWQNKMMRMRRTGHLGFLQHWGTL